ncbi:MAG: hypothetical protein ACM33T_15680 [Solirubrobacterales bacterium]
MIVTNFRIEPFSANPSPAQHMANMAGAGMSILGTLLLWNSPWQAAIWGTRINRALAKAWGFG